MKKSKLIIPGILIVLFIAGSCTSRTDRTMVEIHLLLDSLKLEYAPDTRLALWNLEVSEADRLISLHGEVDSKESFRAIVRAMDEKFPDVDNQLKLLPEGGEDRLVNGLVNNAVAHVRSRRSHMSDLATEALLGTPVRILKEEQGWFLIQLPNKYIGWVKDSEVYPLDRDGLSLFRDSMKVIYSKQYGLSHAEPDDTSLPVSNLVVGCLFPVLFMEGGYYQVAYPDGRLAWVKQDECTPASQIFGKRVSAEGIVETVHRFHGIPYLWGGFSSKGIDCSGLSATVFFMNGLVLPRDADQQSLIGTQITTDYEWEVLETGDLLFFGSEGSNRTDNITHMAIYLGDSEFIHASGYLDRVSINSMDSTRENFISYFPDIFVRAVRIMGEEYRGFEPITKNVFYKEIIKPVE